MEDGHCVRVLQAGGLLLDTYTGNLATAKEKQQLSINRRFIEREMGSACSQDVLLLLVDVYAKQVLSPDSSIAGRE